MEPQARPRRVRGKAPRLTRNHQETICSHDGSPISVIFKYVVGEEMRVPRRSLEIYDTTPGAKDRFEKLASDFQTQTSGPRWGEDGEFADRVEVVAFPLSDETTQEERVARCVEHLTAEAAVPDREYKLYEWGSNESQDYRKGLIIIDSENWEDGMLFVTFDLRKKDSFGVPLPEVSVRRCAGLHRMPGGIYSATFQWNRAYRFEDEVDTDEFIARND